MKALYNVQNSANGGILPDLIKASLPSGAGYRRVVGLIVIEITGLQVCSFASALVRNVQSLSIPLFTHSANKECSAQSIGKELWERQLMWNVSARHPSKGLVHAVQISDPEFVYSF